MGKFKLPHLSTAQRTALTLDAREIVFDDDLNLLYYGDGATLGGLSLVGPAGPLANVVDDLTPQLGGFLDPNGNYVGSDKGGDIASSAPLVIGTDGDYFDVTGTTGFSVMTVAANRLFRLQFDGILTIVHGGSINLPGGVNFTTAVGDEITFFSTASNTVRVVAISKADGTPIVGGGFTLGTEQNASGTSNTFSGIPSGVKQININFNGVSTDSTGHIEVRLGDSGGIESSGYIMNHARFESGGVSSISSSTLGIIIQTNNNDDHCDGTIIISLENEPSNTWNFIYILSGDIGRILIGSGVKSLSSEITQLEIATESRFFDFGNFNISYI